MIINLTCLKLNFLNLRELLNVILKNYYQNNYLLIYIDLPIYKYIFIHIIIIFISIWLMFLKNLMLLIPTKDLYFA